MTNTQSNINTLTDMTKADLSKSSRDMLLEILQGDMKSSQKIMPMILNGPRLANKTLRRLVEKYRKVGLDAEQIVQKLLDYDQIVEKGKVTQQNILENVNKTL